MANVKNHQSSHPLYHTWQEMKRRCFDPRRAQYKNYGGRGIKVCDRWLSDFWNFVEDMGERPEGMTLDREDNDRDYSPENCSWATLAWQATNRRDTVGRDLPRHVYNWRDKFQIAVTRNRQRTHLGTYPTVEAAVKAVAELKKEGVL